MMLEPIGDAIPGALWTLLTLPLGAVLGAAWEPITRAPDGFDEEIEFDEALYAAYSRTEWHVWSRVVRPIFRWIRNIFGERGSSQSDESFWIWVIGIAVLVSFVLSEYVRHTVGIVFVLLALAVFMLAATAITLGLLTHRHVISATGIARQLVGSIAMSTTAILNAIWLISPPVGSHVLTSIRHALLASPSFVSILFAPNIPFVALQLVGAGITLIALIVSTALCIACLSAVYIALDSRPRWLWPFLFWVTRSSTYPSFWWILFALCALSLLLTGGFAYVWLEHSPSSTPNPTFSPR